MLAVRPYRFAEPLGEQNRQTRPVGSLCGSYGFGGAQELGVRGTPYLILDRLVELA